MTAVLSPPKTRSDSVVTLPGISWETYESLLTDLSDRSVPHLTYDRGTLIIMSPTAEHERYNRAIARLVEVLTEEFEVEMLGLGSTTFRRKEVNRGFEPDSCFYIQNERLVRGKKRLDLSVDPPPDLIIEIDITSPSLDRFPIFAQFGVPEVWRFDGERLEIFKLSGEAYERSERSEALPFVDADALAAFVKESFTLGSLEWVRKVREWARGRKGAE